MRLLTMTTTLSMTWARSAVRSVSSRCKASRAWSRWCSNLRDLVADQGKTHHLYLQKVVQAREEDEVVEVGLSIVDRVVLEKRVR